MGLTVALGLRGLDEPLKTCAQRGDFLGERLSSKRLNGEHATVAEVAVVRNSQDLSACLLFELGEMPPEVLGILAVELGIRDRSVGYARIAAKDHIAVEIVTSDRSPLEADQRREASRLIVLVGQRSVGVPSIADCFLAFDGRYVTGKISDNLHRGGEYAIVVSAL